MTAPFRVRRGAPEDALAMTRAVHVAQAFAYAGIMPAQFAVDRIGEIPDEAAALRTRLAHGLEVEANGGEPLRRWWLAEDDEEVVAVACAGAGPREWEAGYPPPPTAYQLEKLYALPRAHGTGVGQALLDLAVPAGTPAYLWVLAGNPRAEAFYRRNGFVAEPYVADCGDRWFNRPMSRMVRGL